MKAYHQGQLDFFCAIYAVINANRLLFGCGLEESRNMLAAALDEISSRPVLWNALLRNQTDHHWVVNYMLGRFCGADSTRKVRVAKLPPAPLSGLQEANEQTLTEWLAPQPPAPLCLDSLGGKDMHMAGIEFGYTMPWPDPEKRARRTWTQEQLWALMQQWLPTRKFINLFSGSKKKQKRCLILRFHRFVAYHPAPVVCHWSTGQNFTKDNLQLYDCTANAEAVHSLPLEACVIYPENLGDKRFLALEPESIYFIEKI